MSFLKNASVSTKLYLLVALFIVGFSGFGVIAKDTLDTLRIQGPIYDSVVQSKDLVADILPPPEYIIESYLVAWQASQLTDAARIREAMSRFGKLREEYDARREHWTKALESGAMKDLLLTESYRPAKEFYELVEREYFPALLAGDRARASAALTGPLSAKYEEHRAAIDRLVKLATASSEGQEKHAATVIANRSVSLLAVGVGIIVLCITIALVITRSISGPVRRIVAVVEQIAEGDLRGTAEVDRRDEVGRLQSAVKRMLDKLRQIIGDVRTGADALSAAAGQVSSTAQALTQGTGEQAASVEETSSSLEEISASITQNAENSRQAEQMASKGARGAEESGGVVKDAVEAMKSIAERISIIEEMAYQTNLLALNAAIEAARAGEHGRGFAVVAQEVRKLAERAQKAAGEIGTLATSSVNVAERSGQLIVELVPSIKKTAELVQEVAAASQEQSSGVGQINKAMGAVEQVTQRNASAAEELSSTAEEMAIQAESLQQLMSFFKVNGGYDGASQRPAVPHAPALQPAAPAPHVALSHPAVASGKANGGAHPSDHGFKHF